MKQKSKGGKRPGAGRKPSPNPKKPLTLYIEDASVKKWGGWDELKKKLYDFISFPNQFDPQFSKFPIEVSKQEPEKPLTFKKATQKATNKAKEPEMGKGAEVITPIPEAYNGPKIDSKMDEPLLKHPLWKPGDPAEKSMAFYMKFDCYTYEELQNIKNQSK